MKNYIFGDILLIALLFSKEIALALDSSICTVFDPFRVQPDNNKFQIGGAFPLHKTDCLHLNLDAVQDIVAIQWALTHWNQNVHNSASKIGLYAGDTCSRPREAISQTVRFLETSGYFEAEECHSLGRRRRATRLLGLASPKDRESAQAIATTFKMTTLPIVTYSTASIEAFINNDITDVITTAPPLSIYVEAFIEIMKKLNSNLITIVDNGRLVESILRINEQLEDAGIFVSEIISHDDTHLIQMLSNSDSSIILSFLTKEELIESFGKVSQLHQSMLWIAVLTDSDSLSPIEQIQLLHNDSFVKMIVLQQKQVEFAQFGDYFQRVLINNYHTYTLLTEYFKQAFNCTMNETDESRDCSTIDRNRISDTYEQATSVEAAVRMAYALALIGAAIGKNSTTKTTCELPTKECKEKIFNEIFSMNYEFATSDPEEFAGKSLHFYQNSDSVFVSNGIIIEAIELLDDPHLGPMISKAAEYEIGRKTEFRGGEFRSANIKSICPIHRSYCGNCERIVAVEQKNYYLSVPKEYPIYLMGLFDLHSGASCENPGNPDISLPLAFSYAISKHRKLQQKQLSKDFDIGILITDSCSRGRTAVESVVTSENQCFLVQQANRNVTIAHNSIFGYVSAIHQGAHLVLRSLFETGEKVLIGVNPEVNAFFDEFSMLPSIRSQTLALCRLLRKFRWEFITVVLSEQDSESTAFFNYFERVAKDRGVCIAEIIQLNGETPLANVDFTSTTNLTVLFTTAVDATNYFAARLRRDSNPARVHVVIGAAHDFFLFDPSNIASFVGTVSIQPKSVITDDFREWMENITPLTFSEPWFWDYVEKQWHCSLSTSHRQQYNTMCTGAELLDVPGLGRMTKTGYLSLAIEKLLETIHSVHRKLCLGYQDFCAEFHSNGKKEILKTLRNKKNAESMEIYEFLPDSRGSFGYELIGNWSLKTGLQLIEDDGKDQITFNRIASRCIAPLCSCSAAARVSADLLDDVQHVSSYVHRQPTVSDVSKQLNSVFEQIFRGHWRSRASSYVFLVLITILLISALTIFILVCVKIYYGVIKGNQSLGTTLLIGIIMITFTAYLFVLDPTDMLCRMRAISHSVGYTVVFGVMVAKATQLRNAETLGFSSAGYISYWNYWLLLLFIIGVQIALSLRWIAEHYTSSIAYNASQNRLLCAYSDGEFLTSQLYALILLLLSLFINIRNRNIKRNYKETRWLVLASLTCLVIWVSWMFAYWMVPMLFKSDVVVIELILCSATLLSFLFGPKVYILMSYETVVIERESQNIKSGGALYENGLFEQDDELKRTVSAAVSEKSANCSFRAQSPASNNQSSLMDGEQNRIFLTVTRKKTKGGRSSSERDSIRNKAKPSEAPHSESVTNVVPNRGSPLSFRSINTVN